MRFKDLINDLYDIDEQAIAMDGDYDFGNLNYVNNTTNILSKEVTIHLLDTNYKGEKIHVFKQKFIDNMVLIGTTIKDPQISAKGTIYDYKERYFVIGAMLLNPIVKLKKLGYNKNAFEVKGVEILKTHRGKGYGKFFYEILIKKLNYILVGDLEQYTGARKLWVSLPKDDAFKVDIIDIDKRIIIEKDVKLKDIFDERIWVKHQEIINKTLNQIQDRVGKFHRLILTKID